MTTEKFHWTSPGGVEIVLPRLAKVKSSVLRKNRLKEADDYMFSVIEAVADEETLALIDDLDTEDFAEMTSAWAETSVGESSGSST